MKPVATKIAYDLKRKEKVLKTHIVSIMVLWLHKILSLGTVIRMAVIKAQTNRDPGWPSG